MTKQASKKMAAKRHYALSLSIVLLSALLFVSCNNPASPDKVDLGTSQKYLFEVSRANAAWGYVNEGIYIDSQGRVYGYDLSRLGWRDANKYHPEDGVYSEAMLEEKFSITQQYFQTVDSDILTKMSQLIAPASLGSLTDPVNIGNDMGGTTYTAFLYDENSGNYKEVLLYQWGDWTIENTSKEAKVLHGWLQGFSTSPYQKSAGATINNVVRGRRATSPHNL